MNSVVNASEIKKRGQLDFLAKEITAPGAFLTGFFRLPEECRKRS
jgi:hypothetical protein